ncbi:hypothetical protein BASA82_000655, partial [Batrachochytrium salamandrivorans]
MGSPPPSEARWVNKSKSWAFVFAGTALGSVTRGFPVQLPRWMSPKRTPSFSQFSKPVRLLTDFALYDTEGRLVPMEALSLAGVGEITAFGTLLRGNTATQTRPPFPLQEDQVASLVLLNQPALVSTHPRVHCGLPLIA